MDSISAELLRHYSEEVEDTRTRAAVTSRRDGVPVSAHVRWDRWLARRQTVVFPGNNWQTAACHLCWPGAQGPTAVLKSVSKLDNTLLSNGTLLNVKFTPATLEGEERDTQTGRLLTALPSLSCSIFSLTW
ncbi:glycine radical domain-containing protein [Escherichia coli]